MSDQELVTVYAEDELASGSYQALQKELQRQERRIEAQQQELDELRAQVRALIGGRAAVRE
jgi:cell division protein FtsL